MMNLNPQLYTKINQLPPNIQVWVDGNAKLPKEVDLYPVQTKSIWYVTPWLLLALLFLTMSMAAPVTFFTTFQQIGWTHLTAYFLFGAVFLLLMLGVVLYAILIGPIRDAQLTVDKQNGRLRHGVFITSEEILIRLPHELHYLPRSRVKEVQEVVLQKGSRRLTSVELTLDNAQILTIRPKLTISRQSLLKKLTT